MTISKFKVFLKWLFSGTESVIDYVLSVLNSFLAREDVAKHVEEGYTLSKTVLQYLTDYEDWCPQKWLTRYEATVDAVATVVGAFADSKIEAAEIANITAKFQTAYAAWIAE